MSFRPRWTTLALAIPLALGACLVPSSSFTPPGTVIGQQALYSYWPSTARSSLATIRPEVAERRFSLGTDGLTEGKVVFEHVTAPDTGGRYLRSVSVEVVQNVDYQITFGGFGSASNAGTPQRVNMMVPFTVKYRSLTGDSAGMSKFKLFADGRLLGR